MQRLTLRKGVLGLLGALASFACSSNQSRHLDAGILPDAGGAQVTGTVGGSGFTASDGIFAVREASGLEFTGPSTDVLISDFGTACARRESGTGVPGGRMLFIGLADIDGAGTASAVTVPGTYGIVTGTPAPSTHAAQMFYERDDSNCIKTEQHEAATGNVVVTAVDAAIVTGTFDVVLGDTHEHVVGSFSVLACDAFDPNGSALCP